MAAVNSSAAILALDVGERRIGLALAQFDVKFAHPHGFVDRTTDYWQQLDEIIRSERVGQLVVGWPRGMDGQETNQTRAVAAFIDELAGHFTLPITRQDESVTSKQAEAELEARGVRYTKGDVDALAATYILTDFLQDL